MTNLKNNDDLIKNVLDRLKPLIKKLSSKLVNSNGDFEDYYQEITLKLISVMRNKADEYVQLSEKDVVNICIAVAKNYYVDIVRSCVNKPDLSIFAPRVEDSFTNLDNGSTKGVDNVSTTNYFIDSSILSQFCVFSSMGRQEEAAISKDLFHKLISLAEKESRGSSDLVRFIREMTFPSKYVLNYYFKWKEQSYKNPHANKSYIPPEIVGRALGFSSSKVSRMKIKLKVMLVKLGMSLYEVFDNPLEISDEWYFENGLTPPKRNIKRFSLKNPITYLTGFGPSKNKVSKSECRSRIGDKDIVALYMKKGIA